jgi:putative ABC transport system permease protein
MTMLKAFGAAFRNLRRAPAFTGLVVVTLALGIGATTAMFSVVDALLINPLPFSNADRMSEAGAVSGPSGAIIIPRGNAAILEVLRRETSLFTSVEASQFATVDVTGGGDPDIVAAPLVTPGLLTMLGVRPEHGRLFTDEDAQSGGVVIVSHSLWSARYGSDPALVGREITLDDQPHRVIGVMPPNFRFPERNVRMWRPLKIAPTQKPGRLQVIVVRRPELTAAQINERLKALTPALRASGAIAATESLATGVLTQQRFGQQSSQALYILFGAVWLVMLVACVNVMNLLLTRASSRAGEFALKAALGGTRAGLVRAVLIESALLAGAGCLAGIALARVLLRLILNAAPPNLTFLSAATSSLDLRAVSFAVVIAVATCLVFGLLPAWRAARVDAIEILKQRATAVSAADDWWQGGLVVAQLSLVLVLLSGAGLLLRSFDRLVSVDPGFVVDELGVLEIQLPAHRYGAPGAALSFMQEVERRVETRPGVRASVSGGAPPTGGGFSFDIKPEAEGGLPVDFSNITLPFSSVSPDYFETMGVPLIAGRTFVPEDGRDAVILNDIMARRFWDDASPIGRRFRIDDGRPWQTVVGVVADVKQMGPSDPMGEGMEFYQLLPRDTRTAFYGLVIRTTGDRAAALAAAKQFVWELDPKLPVLETATMEERIGEAIARPRFYLALSSAFALSGAALAAIGVYGVSAYWVSRRRRELAIRIAVGASAERVMGLVIGRSLKLTALGVTAGLAMALAGTRLIESMLFQVDGRDPITLVSVTVLLGALVLLGCIGPAWRASRVDPMTTLRAE